MNTLRYVVDVDHDNMEIVSVIHYPGRGICVEYKDKEDSGSPYISRAVLVDGDNRVSYAVEIYDRNLVDLTDVAK